MDPITFVFSDGKSVLVDVRISKIPPSIRMVFLPEPTIADIGLVASDARRLGEILIQKAQEAERRALKAVGG